MWFDELMDCCKQGIKSSNDNKGVFIPIFLNLAINFLMAIPLILIGIIFIGIYGKDIGHIIDGNGNLLSVLIPAMIIIIFFLVIYMALKTLIEVGSINVYLSAINGAKPKTQHFFEGIRRCFSKVFGVKIVIYILFALLLIPIVALFLLYSATIGVLTAGWGIVFAFVIIGVYFSTWVIAIVADNLSGLQGIEESIRLGKKNFWLLFIFLLSKVMILKYVSVAFGGLVALVGGWILSLILTTYFQMILVTIYKNKSEQFVKVNQ